MRKFKDFARRMYRSYMGHLADTNKFDLELQNAVTDMQHRLVESGKLHTGGFLVGVLDIETQYASGFKKRPAAARPVIFTVEGHMSNMWMGPCASVASFLEGQGVCRWQPVGYNSNALPFDNKSGVDELVRLVGDRSILPENTNWGIIGFSQGAMVVSDFMSQHVIPEGGVLHWRLKDFKRGLCFGNPRRERDAVCGWAQNPPDSGTHGIMDKLFNASQTVIKDRWAEHPNNGDMFTEIGDTKADKDKTAIAKIICENSWFGGPTAIFARVLALFGNPVGEGFAAIKASFDAIMFLASNPNPHYSTVSEPGDISWMHGVAA